MPSQFSRNLLQCAMSVMQFSVKYYKNLQSLFIFHQNFQRMEHTHKSDLYGNGLFADIAISEEYRFLGICCMHRGFF